MKLGSSARYITIDESKFAFMVVYDGWHYKRERFETMVYKRTNDRKTAERALKALIKKHSKPVEQWLRECDPEADNHRSHNERIIERSAEDGY